MTVRIERPLDEISAFLADPPNFSRWASGLGRLTGRAGGRRWVAEGEDGAKTEIEFSEPNAFGVADHTVFPPSKEEVYVPMRAHRNGTGSEVAITLIREPGMTDERFEADSDWVARDLERLRAVLEGAAERAR
ncbi:MAG TPA: hypothetical protein VIA06_13140 [Candidatus Dormibacteraeota bacterium]|jgi:hypothetical protein|nr:hypothetical protein [Candidatus Dormibacteraeota bacterium]